MPKKILTPEPEPNPTLEILRQRLRRLGLYGLFAQADRLLDASWLGELLDIEESERQRRSLERRLRNARIGTFKPMVDFDWNWPKHLDRALLDELLSLQFLAESGNVILVGPNGVGKTMIAKNLAHLAVVRGATARFTTASEMLHDLAAQDSDGALARRLRHYCRPHLLVVDELGYLSYDNRYADLLFEVVSRRYQQRSIVLTTNKPFAEWTEVFPNAACVVTLVDRLVHQAEVVSIAGASYRLKEAKERTERKAKARSKSK